MVTAVAQSRVWPRSYTQTAKSGGARRVCACRRLGECRSAKGPKPWGPTHGASAQRAAPLHAALNAGSTPSPTDGSTTAVGSAPCGERRGARPPRAGARLLRGVEVEHRERRGGAVDERRQRHQHRLHRVCGPDVRRERRVEEQLPGRVLCRRACGVAGPARAWQSLRMLHLADTGRHARAHERYCCRAPPHLHPLPARASMHVSVKVYQARASYPPRRPTSSQAFLHHSTCCMVGAVRSTESDNSSAPLYF